MSVGVVGSGAFGTALAVSLARKGPVDLWARDADQVAQMQAERMAPRLPGVPLPETIRPTGDIDALSGASALLLSVPMQQLRGLLERYREVFAGRRLVACCKGIELSTGLGPVALIAECVPDARPAILTGPSFAADIARGLPTALTLACADETAGIELQADLSTESLRLYRTTDTAGAELGGAMKNVIAISCGAAIGANLGDSCRAALMTRGYAEMVRLGLTRGARAETLAGLSGFGDLALTCTSELSRNFRLGLAIGRREPFDPSVTVEGAATARAVDAICDDLGLDMPITRAVVRLVDGSASLDDVITGLLARSLKPE